MTKPTGLVRASLHSSAVLFFIFLSACATMPKSLTKQNLSTRPVRKLTAHELEVRKEIGSELALVPELTLLNEADLNAPKTEIPRAPAEFQASTKSPKVEVAETNSNETLSSRAAGVLHEGQH